MGYSEYGIAADVGDIYPLIQPDDVLSVRTAADLSPHKPPWPLDATAPVPLNNYRAEVPYPVLGVNYLQKMKVVISLT